MASDFSSVLPPSSPSPAWQKKIEHETPISTFEKQHLESREWKGWEIVLVVLSFPLSIPIIYLSTKVNNYLTKNILLGSLLSDKEMLKKEREQFIPDTLLEENKSTQLRNIKDYILRLNPDPVTTSLRKEASKSNNKEPDLQSKLPEIELDDTQIEEIGKNLISIIIPELNKKIKFNKKIKQNIYDQTKTRIQKLIKELKEYQEQKRPEKVFTMYKMLIEDLGEEQVLECLKAASDHSAPLPSEKEIAIASTDRYQNINIKTKDGATLDGFIIQNKGQSKISPEKQKWMVCYLSKDDTYEYQLKKFNEISEKEGVNILTINYRGVGKSVGPERSSLSPSHTSHDLIADGVAAAQHLIEIRGVRPGNILAYGHSQGSAIAVHVAALHPGMHLCMDRGFTNYTDATQELVHSLHGEIIGKIASSLIPGTWQFDNLEAYRKVTGKKMIIDHPSDEIIRGSARIGAAVKKIMKNEEEMGIVHEVKLINLTPKNATYKGLPYDGGISAHNEEWDKEAKKTFGKFIRDIFRQISETHAKSN